MITEPTREQDAAAETLALSYSTVCCKPIEAGAAGMEVHATTVQEAMNFTTRAHYVDTFVICPNGETYYYDPRVGSTRRVDPLAPKVLL